MGAQDGHLDFHTAPELWVSSFPITPFKSIGLINPVTAFIHCLMTSLPKWAHFAKIGRWAPWFCCLSWTETFLPCFFLWGKFMRKNKIKKSIIFLFLFFFFPFFFIYIFLYINNHLQVCLFFFWTSLLRNLHHRWHKLFGRERVKHDFIHA